MKANLAFIISALILFGLLVSIIVGTQTIGVSGQLTPRSTYSPGDPYTTLYYPPTEVPPPNYAKQPIVTNLSPANDTVIATNNCCFKFIFDLGGNKQLSSYHSWTSIIQSKLDVEQCYD